MILLKSIGNIWIGVRHGLPCLALHGFGASASLEGEASGRLEGLHGLFVRFGVCLASSQGRVANLMLFLASPGDGVG